MHLATVGDYYAFAGSDLPTQPGYLLWNLGITQQVLRNKKGEISLTVMNVLNQNQSIQHNVYDNIIEDIFSNRQGRYGLLTFTYFFSKKGRK